MRIRQATINDVSAVVPLWQEMMHLHAMLDPERFRPADDSAAYWAKVLPAWLKDEKCCVLVADDGERLIGYIVGWLHQSIPVFQPDLYGFVSDICVAADCRQRGVGRQMFEALKAWFSQHGASHVELRIAVTNPVSQTFWREMGCEDYLDHMWCPL